MGQVGQLRQSYGQYGLIRGDGLGFLQSRVFEIWVFRAARFRSLKDSRFTVLGLGALGHMH